MVDLFSQNWDKIRVGACSRYPQNRLEGTLHLKGDFEGVYECLEYGWDTKIKDVLSNKSIQVIANSIDARPNRNY